MKTIKILLLLAVVGIVAGAVFVYSGVYDIGADRPHGALVLRAIDTLRARSITAHAQEVGAVPNLQDPKLIAEGAEHYAEMCTGCHLAPGMDDSEMRAGLYPKPPKLAGDTRGKPAEQFWIIKHGVKLSAMPAWGPTHDDDKIWAMVAFVQQLPGMTPGQYAEATGAADEHERGHHHHGDEHGEDLDEKHGSHEEPGHTHGH